MKYVFLVVGVCAVFGSGYLLSTDYPGTGITIACLVLVTSIFILFLPRTAPVQLISFHALPEQVTYEVIAFAHFDRGSRTTPLPSTLFIVQLPNSEGATIFIFYRSGTRSNPTLFQRDGDFIMKM